QRQRRLSAVHRPGEELKGSHGVRSCHDAVPSPCAGRIWHSGPMQPLVSSRELADLLDRAGVVVLDVRWRLGGPSARADYDEAHLPDAVFVDLETALSAPPDARGRHPLPDADHFTAQMRAAGVRAESHVVCYDDGPG